MTHYVSCIFILLVLYVKTVSGQQVKDFDIRIKFQPTALIAFPRPTIQGGMEIRYKKIGVDLSYGHQWAFLLSENPDTVRVSNFGNRYRVAFRYYLEHLEMSPSTIPFYSIGYSKIYSIQNYTQHWFSGSTFDPSLAVEDIIHIFSANLGFIHSHRNFLMEGIFGTGIRFRTARSLGVNGSILEEDKRILPHVGFMVRIGYIVSP